MPRTRTASTTTPGKAGGVRSTPVSATPGRQGASSQTDPPLEVHRGSATPIIGPSRLAPLGRQSWSGLGWMMRQRPVLTGHRRADPIRVIPSS